MVPKFPHAPLQVSLSSFLNPGTTDLGEEESKWWEKKINKNKASDLGGKIAKQQGTVQVSVCKIALCLYTFWREAGFLEQICIFFVIFLSS